MQAVGFQAGEDARRGTGFLPGGIEVLHAQQPEPAVVAGVEVARQGGYQ